MSVAALTSLLIAWLTIWVTPAGDRILIKHARTLDLAVIAQDILDASEAADIPPELVAAVAFVESGINPSAVGDIGERSIMQLNVRNRQNRTALSQGPRAARFRGASILAREFHRCGASWTEALNAYHSGNCSPAPSRYVRRVYARMDAP